MTQSPQDTCTGGMERDEGGEENKAGLRWVTHKSLGMVWGSWQVRSQSGKAARVQCRYQQDLLQLNAATSPHQTPSPPRRAGSGESG